MIPQEAPGTVALHVSNQSFEVSPVDIAISIDGQTIVQGEFDVQGDQPPQHNWHRYDLRIEEGPHELVAKSSKGRAQLRTSFEMPGVQTITIAYWCGRRQPGKESEGYFTIEFGSNQAATM